MALLFHNARVLEVVLQKRAEAVLQMTAMVLQMRAMAAAAAAMAAANVAGATLGP